LHLSGASPGPKSAPRGRPSTCLRIEEGVGHTITPTMQRDLWIELGADTSREAAAAKP
jgi:hypothetical protein